MASSGLNPASTTTTWAERIAPLVRTFHRYANWLVGISWRKFILLAILLLIAANVLSGLPPFTWTMSEQVEMRPSKSVKVSKAPQAPTAPAAPEAPVPPEPGASGESPAAPAKPKSGKEPLIKIETPKKGNSGDVVITIAGERIVISPDKGIDAAASAVKAAEAAASAAGAAAMKAASAAGAELKIVLPAGADKASMQAAVEAARQAAQDAAEAARSQAEAARELAEQARDMANDARDAAKEAVADAVEAAVADAEAPTFQTRITRTSFGEFLPELAFLWIIASAVIKATYKGQLKAEAAAAQAAEVAESEQLKRQVVEARMAAMQAQVEPHFLFNTLASIDHLIETDPPRASQMQKNLIALLRASMPTLREANQGGPRDLGREMAVIRPYLEILKVRMEDRLVTHIEVPDGLLSAEFPSMMIQSLVENAIKHGLEPKAEGGELTIRAEIVHGKLAVTVSDTGLGFGRAATAGTGVGLANIRERLQLLYGATATLVVNENQPSGTKVTVTVPYKSIEAAANTAAAGGIA
jgi:signal transduction histidine kinase